MRKFEGIRRTCGLSLQMDLNVSLIEVETGSGEASDSRDANRTARPRRARANDRGVFFILMLLLWRWFLVD